MECGESLTLCAKLVYSYFPGFLNFLEIVFTYSGFISANDLLFEEALGDIAPPPDKGLLLVDAIIRTELEDRRDGDALMQYLNSVPCGFRAETSFGNKFLLPDLE